MAVNIKIRIFLNFFSESLSESLINMFFLSRRHLRLRHFGHLVLIHVRMTEFNARLFL